jgi:hypothetical protein
MAASAGAAGARAARSAVGLAHGARVRAGAAACAPLVFGPRRRAALPRRAVAVRARAGGDAPPELQWQEAQEAAQTVVRSLEEWWRGRGAAAAADAVPRPAAAAAAAAAASPAKRTPPATPLEALSCRWVALAAWASGVAAPALASLATLALSYAFACYEGLALAADDAAVATAARYFLAAAALRTAAGRARDAAVALAAPFIRYRVALAAALAFFLLPACLITAATVVADGLPSRAEMAATATAARSRSGSRSSSGKKAVAAQSSSSGKKARGAARGASQSPAEVAALRSELARLQRATERVASRLAAMQ